MGNEIDKFLENLEKEEARIEKERIEEEKKKVDEILEKERKETRSKQKRLMEVAKENYDALMASEDPARILRTNPIFIHNRKQALVAMQSPYHRAELMGVISGFIECVGKRQLKVGSQELRNLVIGAAYLHLDDKHALKLFNKFLKGMNVSDEGIKWLRSFAKKYNGNIRKYLQENVKLGRDWKRSSA